MIRIVMSVMTPLLRSWIKRYQHIDSNVLIVYLTSGILDFGTSFTKKEVLVPTWSMIEEADKSLNWVAIL